MDSDLVAVMPWPSRVLTTLSFSLAVRELREEREIRILETRPRNCTEA